MPRGAKPHDAATIARGGAVQVMAIFSLETSTLVTSLTVPAMIARWSMASWVASVPLSITTPSVALTPTSEFLPILSAAIRIFT